MQGTKTGIGGKIGPASTAAHMSGEAQGSR